MRPRASRALALEIADPSLPLQTVEDYGPVKFYLILLGPDWLIRFTAWRHPAFKARLGEQNFTAQIKIGDDTAGRYYSFQDGVFSSHAGIHPEPDVCLSFKSQTIAVQLLVPPVDYQQQIDAQKEFNLKMTGPDELTYWFAQTIMKTQNSHWKFGVDLADGTKRCTSMTNGGPIRVDVKDGKLVRTGIIEFSDDDPGTWTIEARGKEFSPPRKTTLSPHGQNWKSAVYSPDRILTPSNGWTLTLMASAIARTGVCPDTYPSVGMKPSIPLHPKSKE